MHDTALSAPVRANGVACHVRAAVGFVETRTLPTLSTATHNRTVGHERASSRLGLSTAIGRDHLSQPPGLVEVSTRPPSSTAAHIDIVGQEMAFRGVSRSMFHEVHARALLELGP